jgi:hypothetical protein
MCTLACIRVYLIASTSYPVSVLHPHTSTLEIQAAHASNLPTRPALLPSETTSKHGVSNSSRRCCKKQPSILKTVTGNGPLQAVHLQPNIPMFGGNHVKFSGVVPQRRAPMHQHPPMCLLILFQRASASSTPHTQ